MSLRPAAVASGRTYRECKQHQRGVAPASMIGKTLPLTIDPIDAPTGATITSLAVVNAANDAFKTLG